MKILIVSGGRPTDKSPLTGIFEFDQAKALQEFGHQVLFTSIDLRSIRRKRKFGKRWILQDGINVVDVSIPLGRLPKFILHFFGKMSARILVKDIINNFGKPDIIHAHFFDIGIISSVFKDKLNVPFVFTEHSSLINRDTLPKNIHKKGMELFSKTDLNIAVSHALSNRLEEHWGISSIVIPNIVDVDIFKFDSSYEKASSDFTFVSVGQLNYNKGFDVLINAFYKANFDKNVKLIIIGSGELSDELNKLINKYGLLNQIFLLGYMERAKIAELMKQSDAFVLASRSETFGVVYIEAMAAGLPVIATLCGGPEDFVDGDNGVLVEVDDVHGLSKALIYMRNNINSFDKKQISNKSFSKFSSYAIAKLLTTEYNRILGLDN